MCFIGSKVNFKKEENIRVFIENFYLLTKEEIFENLNSMFVWKFGH
jgi:hypothetical protein